MASKYSALPDIDDQPDVYETPDVSDRVQATAINDAQSSDEDDGNENVIRASTSVKDASARFKDSVVDTSGTDFSDRLTRKKKAMYRSYVRRPPSLDTNEFELLPRQVELQETSLQKLRRLMYEVQELNETVEKEKDDESKEDSVSHRDLLSQITYLQNDLNNLSQRMNNVSVDEKESSYGSRVDEAKQLIKQLEAFKSMPSASKEKDEDDTVMIERNEKGDLVTYELYYTPEMAKLQKESKVVDIDERIAKLESLVGTSAGRGLDELPSSLASSSLVASISKFEQQITVLAQPRQLEVVARRVKVLISELDRLNELKAGRKDMSLGFGLVGAGPSNASVSGAPAHANAEEKKEAGGLSNETEEKVNYLFHTMEKVDPLRTLTHALLTRLKALQGLHTEAATFGRSVKVISEEQSRMTDELKSLSSTCELLSQSLKENEESVQNNIKVIDERMTELVKRVGALKAT